MTVAGTSNENIELLFLQLGTVDLTRNDILEWLLGQEMKT